MNLNRNSSCQAVRLDASSYPGRHTIRLPRLRYRMPGSVVLMQHYGNRVNEAHRSIT